MKTGYKKTAKINGAEVVLDMELQLRGRLADTLIRHAEKRGRKPSDLLADIIETVLNDDIVDAVMDDRP